MIFIGIILMFCWDAVMAEIFKIDTSKRIEFKSPDIVKYIDVTLTQCAYQCDVRENCSAGHYHTASRTCELDDSGNYCHDTKAAAGIDVIRKGTASDCSEMPCAENTSGVYTIYPGNTNGVKVYCDMTTDGGGWTVFQRRLDGSTKFDKYWTEYKNGFGTPDNEYWLGNDNLHELTRQGRYQLRVDLADWEGNTTFVIYDTFEVGNEASNYKLTVRDYIYTGNGVDSLSYHDQMAFSTLDRDHDTSPYACATTSGGGGWWYNYCYSANLNGDYNKTAHGMGVMSWYGFRGQEYSLKSSVMMVRKV